MKRRIFDEDWCSWPQPEMEPGDIRQAQVLVCRPANAGLWRMTLTQVFEQFGCAGITETAATPTTTEFPVARSWGFHIDTSTTPDTVYLVFNLDGVIKKAALS